LSFNAAADSRGVCIWPSRLEAARSLNAEL
jgi:hypothetical protein